MLESIGRSFRWVAVFAVKTTMVVLIIVGAATVSSYGGGMMFKSVEDGTRTVLLDKAGGYGHYFTDVDIYMSNGVKYTLKQTMLDTGASVVSIPENMIKELGIEIVGGRKGRSETANGYVETTVFVIPELRVGDIVLRNVIASVRPGGGDVLLGMTVLGEVDLEQKGDQLRLSQRAFAAMRAAF